MTVHVILHCNTGTVFLSKLHVRNSTRMTLSENLQVMGGLSSSQSPQKCPKDRQTSRMLSSLGAIAIFVR
eukprot:4865459-Amphidinium_carterae.1